MCETTYALGHSSAEIQRLKNQAAMLRPITERLLRSAGIDAGMRVLDLGCGAGDVSMLAAELMGSAGFFIQKDCPPSIDQGRAGDYCQITLSNLAEIPGALIGSTAPAARVYYDQAGGVPTGLLDSNVVLDAGNGNRAFGRCTLDLSTFAGLCTFSDGTGTLAGFTARVDVTYLPGQGDGYMFAWDGTYTFRPLPAK